MRVYVRLPEGTHAVVMGAMPRVGDFLEFREDVSDATRRYYQVTRVIRRFYMRSLVEEEPTVEVREVDGSETLGSCNAADVVLLLTRQEARSLLGGLEREETRRGSLSDSRTQIKKRLTDMLGGEDWRAL